MNLKKVTKPGVCAAMRCKEPAAGNFDGVELCERHSAEWGEPGQLELPGLDPVPAPEAEHLALTKEYKEEADEAFAFMSQWEIIDQSTLEQVGIALTTIKARAKEWEANRKRFTKPLNDAKKALDAEFKPAIDALKKCEDLLKGKISAYLRETESRRLADLRSTTESITPVAALPSNMTERKILDFRVVDMDLVPRKYLKLCEVTVRAEMSLRDPATPEIPGLEFFFRSSLTVRS